MYDTSPLPPANTPVPPEASPNEEPAPMLDIHPAHHAAATWRDFCIHIATIVLGLFIAVGLEQTVEAIHHRHQRHQLEERLLEEFRANLQKDEFALRTLADMRAYAVELKSAVTARRTGRPVPAPLPPAATDPRRQRLPTIPTVDTWEAAKENATVALLPSNEIRLYSRLFIQYGLLFVALNDFQHSAYALESFEERFVDSSGVFDMGDPAPPPNLDTMSAAELAEYESLLATYIKSIDRIVVRIHFFDREDRAILDGATDDQDLLRRAFPNRNFGSDTSKDHPAER
jgi:hypothetical protein